MQGHPTTSPLPLSVDAAFAIGAGHTVCQDYARAADAVAILSDGCSSAPMTDIGARLLVQAASDHTAQQSPEGLPLRAAKTAAGWADAMGLPMNGEGPGCLDATLLVAQGYGAELTATIAGDGVLAARRRDGQIESIVVECPCSAPPYPIYSLQPARHRVWRQDISEKTLTLRSAGQTRRWVEGSAPLHLSYPISDYDMLAVFSDGVSSFMGPTGPIPVEQIIDRLMAVRSVRGAFVTRRLRRFLGRFCPNAGWTHGDDVSMAAVALEG